MSLVEAALIVCIVGIVLAVFVPTFVRRVHTNKILEASELLQDLSARTASYYATTWSDGNRRCLPPAAGPTPTIPTEDAEPVDFFDPAAVGHSTWEALGFQPDRPIRYSYRYEPSDSGCGLGGEGHDGTVTWSAEGDLDQDSVRSRFEMRATPTLDGALAPEGVLEVYRRVE